MAIQAQMHDGTILQFPDNTPDDVIDKAAQNYIAESAPVDNSNMLKDFALGTLGEVSKVGTAAIQRANELTSSKGDQNLLGLVTGAQPAQQSMVSDFYKAVLPYIRPDLADEFKNISADDVQKSTANAARLLDSGIPDSFSGSAGKLMGDAAPLLAGGIGNGMGLIAGGALAGASSGALTPTTADTVQQSTQQAGNNMLMGGGGGAAFGALGNAAISGVRAIAPSIISAAANPVATAETVGKSLATVGNAVMHPIETAKAIPDKMADILLNFGQNGVKGSNALNSPFTNESLALEKTTGITLPVGQLTGNKRALMYEGALARSAQTADKMYEVHQSNVQKIDDYVNKTLKAISPTESGSFSTGQKITDTYDKAISSIRTARSTQAKQDFGLAQDLSEGKAFISPDNYAKVLQEFIDNSKGLISTPAQEKAAAEAQGLLSKITKGSTKEIPSSIVDSSGAPMSITPPSTPSLKPITVEDLQNGLKTFGDASHSSGSIWKEINTAGDRRFASEAQKALRADMDAAIATPSANASSEAVQALGIARNRYAKFSQKLDDISNTVLGRYLSNPETRTPERVTEQLLNMRPSELHSTVQILGQHDPEALAATQRFMIENAYNKATIGKGQSGAGLNNVGMNINKFITELPSDKVLSVVFQNQPQAALQIKTIAKASNRIAQSGLRGESPTAPLNEMQQNMNEIASSATNPGALARMAGKFLTRENMVEVLTNPELRFKFYKDIKRAEAKVNN